MTRVVANGGKTAVSNWTGDAATPVATRTHTSDPVPYVLVDSEIDGPGGVYSEAATADDRSLLVGIARRFDLGREHPGSLPCSRRPGNGSPIKQTKTGVESTNG